MKCTVTKPYRTALAMHCNGYGRNKIIDYCESIGMKHTKAKKFVADIVNLTKAAMGKPNKPNGLIDRYIQSNLFGKGELPDGDKTTIATLEKFCGAWRKVR